MSERILTLDLATKTGWAFQSTDGSIDTGVTPFLGTLNAGSRWIRFHAWLNAWRESRPELIVYEEPFIHFKHRTGLGVSYGFTTILQLFAAQNQIRCLPVSARLLKKWATGHGNADKHLMLRFARSMGWELSDDNEIDARWLLEYARKVILKSEAA